MREARAVRGVVSIIASRVSVSGVMLVLAGAISGLAAASVPARAQEPSSHGPGSGQAFGIAVLQTPQPYVGTDAELIVVPILQLRKGGFFIDGIRVGYGWALPANWSLQVSAMPQFAELDPTSSPFLEGMERRRQSVDGVLTLAWESKRLTSSVAAYSDLLGRSDGQRVEGEVGIPLSAARWRIVPAARAVWVDGDFADYYAGIRPAEVRPERPLFRGSSTLSPGLALGVMRPFAKTWVLLARAEVLFLGSGVRDSAVVGDDTMSFGLVGVARQF